MYATVSMINNLDAGLCVAVVQDDVGRFFVVVTDTDADEQVGTSKPFVFQMDAVEYANRCASI